MHLFNISNEIIELFYFDLELFVLVGALLLACQVSNRPATHNK
jgi:hypothetical protein